MYSCGVPPTKTPVRLPRRPTGSNPARSSASHEVSSNNRCCGSIASASRGEIPKNAASKSPASARKAPCRAPPDSSMKAFMARPCQPRSAGKSVISSRLSTSRRQRSSGPRTPPGKRQAMPTITIGSSSVVRRTGSAVSVALSKSFSCRCPARRCGVGWSKTRVAGRRRPVAVFSRLRSSIAVRESNPRSRNGRPAVMSSVVRWVSTVAASERTSSSSRSCCSGAVSPARVWRRAESVPSSGAGSESSLSARATSGMSSISGRRRAMV